MAVVPSGRGLEKLQEFPTEIISKGRLHGTQIYVPFTVARLLYLQILPFLLMLLPFSCNATFLGMQRVWQTPQRLTIPSASSSLAVSWLIQFNVYPPLVPFQGHFILGFLPFPLGHKKQRPWGWVSVTVMLVLSWGEGAVRSHWVPTSWKARTLFRSEAVGREHIVK